MPAGRAIALAAMPTAVLVGMGLSTPLAQADPQPKFKPGKCVSQPDEPDEDGKAAEDEKTDDQAAGEKDGAGEPDASEPSPEPSSGSTPRPEPSPSAESGGSGTEESSGTSESPAETSPEPEPSPSESETRNPLDPLGLGEKITDLFTGGEETAEPSATASPSATAEEKPSEDAEEPADSVRDSAGQAVDEVAGAAGSAAETAEEKAGEVKEAAEKAAGDAKDATAAPSPSATAEDGLQPFPCPEYDAQALADAEVDPTPALLPDEPWILESSKLSLHGLDYKGIVKVRTWSGKVKEVLKFTASGVDIRDLHQMVQAPGGSTTHVKAAKGSNSTIRGGTVTMYTEELKGNLLGIIPITFSPKSPPPLNLPEVFFTGVTVTQAGQFGGDLTVPGMNMYDGG
ncbi:hydrogenase expression protein HypF [Streptomyces sp. F63]|uniref:hydrogenase expression protein HypF n=1 Tax=Streptomyces sp. F63 TaxID=2824887 RepID=UPI001FFC77FD|nr:hydrogenase expression protein HypF [Streptomyces sp. F63]